MMRVLLAGAALAALAGCAAYVLAASILEVLQAEEGIDHE